MEISTQHSAFSRHNGLMLFQPASFPARMQKNLLPRICTDEHRFLRPTLAKAALGWGTLKSRYAARNLEPPPGRFCKHGKHPLILRGLEKCHRATDYKPIFQLRNPGLCRRGEISSPNLGLGMLGRGSGVLRNRGRGDAILHTTLVRAVQEFCDPSRGPPSLLPPATVSSLNLGLGMICRRQRFRKLLPRGQSRH
jgi:hypothetical protein